MSRYHSYINSSEEIISLYKGEEPFPSFLKKYFSSHKKSGSRDRKSISHLCYCYFRLGKTATDLTIEERILAGLFLCSDQPNEVLAALKPEWNHKVQLVLEEKLLIINYSPKEHLRRVIITEVFPWKDELSNGIVHEEFCKSFFIQPNVFLRVRPGKISTVINKLQAAKIGFRIVGEETLAVPGGLKLEGVLAPDKDVVIQDLNSQRTGDFIKSSTGSREPEITVWDCCAGSGGKSIMAYDINPKIDLTVSDVRESILVNLRKRFQSAGIKKYKSFIVDLTSGKPEIQNPGAEIIICDAPCTGSGTWSRTPEQLYFFKEPGIERYSALQKKIVSNVIPRLQKGGSLIYITCSVFRKENEEIVGFIEQNFPLQLKIMEVLKGYDKKADSMFVAVFGKL